MGLTLRHHSVPAGEAPPHKDVRTNGTTWIVPVIILKMKRWFWNKCCWGSFWAAGGSRSS